MHISLFPLSRTRIFIFSLALIFNLSVLVLSQDRPSYLPDPKLSPGDTFEATKDDLCEAGRRALADKISIKVKIQVFDIYRIKADAPVAYNVDHLVPVSLGGTNSFKNLWPQPLSGEWSYVAKNKLEKRLHKLVCGGELELKKAQEEIARNWVNAYKKYVNE